ncbi:hypothetical protein [Nevskia ramosa]|uniref:hypothetical protein n=1 Tax=Nevskia ramosa TaxID=64002 RepID=UPI003D1262D2
MTHPELIEVDIGITPEAAISGAVLLQTEQQAFLTFNAMRATTRPFPHGGFYKEDAGTAIIELVGCTITKFGYPNDEAWSGIPLTRGRSYGIYEVHNSPWKQEPARLNRFSFPSTDEWSGRHFVFLFHDSSFECIATELRLELSEEPYQELFSKVAQRALS